MKLACAVEYLSMVDCCPSINNFTRHLTGEWPSRVPAWQPAVVGGPDPPSLLIELLSFSCFGGTRSEVMIE